MENLKQLTVDDLIRINWNVDEDEIVGVYKGVEIRKHWWTLKDATELEVLTAKRCNLFKGKAHFFETIDGNYINYKKDNSGNPVLIGKNYSGCIEVYDSMGKAVLVLSRKGLIKENIE